MLKHKGCYFRFLCRLASSLSTAIPRKENIPLFIHTKNILEIITGKTVFRRGGFFFPHFWSKLGFAKRISKKFYLKGAIFSEFVVPNTLKTAAPNDEKRENSRLYSSQFHIEEKLTALFRVG